MSFSYQEGQVFSDKLTLLAPLQQDSLGETWLATDAERHARVSWRVFYQPLTPERQSALAQRINLVHPLIHSSIARTFELGREGETDYLVSEYHKGSAFDLNADLTSVWPLIQQLIAALIYAESLGFADGNLRPDRLLVSDEQILTIQFFGLDLPLDAEDPQMAYLSPNIQAGGVASPSDDVFSLGQLLCRLITGETHNPSSDPLSASLQSISVPKALVPLLASMLDPDPVRRPALRQVEEHLSTIMDPRQQQIIIEPGFQRPTLDEGASITQHTDGQTVSTRTAILGFGVILLTALLLFTLIPAPDIADPNSASPSSANPSSVPAKDALADHRQATGTSNYSDSPPEDEKLAPWEMAKTENAKHRGKTIAEDIIRLQLSLEEKGVQIWSPITYEESLNLAAKADDLYRSEAYVEALAGYEAAYTILSETITRLPAVLQNNLDLGTKALAEGDHEAAISAFTIVTTIEPENTVAQASLLRAENLQSVVALTTRAAALEYENQLEEALTLYQQAQAKDPLWINARQGVERVSDKIDRQRFREAMSTGFVALADRQFERAKKAFKEAASIMPGSNEAKDALLQVDVEEKTTVVSRLSYKAAQLEQSEDWQGALDTYRQILAEDPSIHIAQQGQARAETRWALDQSLQSFIAHPESLQSDTELARAGAILTQASQIASPGPRLSGQLASLSRSINKARIPLTLTLRSDNKTEITIYKIGVLGRFTETELKLVPGTYTIAGKRSGYKDEYTTVKLLAGVEPDAIFLSCQEKL